MQLTCTTAPSRYWPGWTSRRHGLSPAVARLTRSATRCAWQRNWRGGLVMGSENKWTPGPWETDQNEHDQPYLPYSIRPQDSRFHNICKVWIDDAPVPDYNAEQKANAHLIA